MQTGTDLAPLRRREILVWLGVLSTTPVWAAAPPNTTLIAAWQDRDEQRIGQLSVGETSWSVQHSLVVPTRAHGLWAEPDGHVLAVARRPGDWLLRWHPRSGKAQWHWIDGDRRFNGHVTARAGGTTLWTTETDLDSAQGRIGVREARVLERTDEWATHGMDPHQLLELPRAVGDFPAGTLMVANGGIPTLPETGRSKRALGRMDSSLVALHPASGALLGQWRLADPFLSIRHLAFDRVSGTLGVALQAEHPPGHPDPKARASAPVLAVWDGRALRAAEGQPPVAGYGGDICALPPSEGGGFAVSCPRTSQLMLYDAHGDWQRALAHRDACALASQGSRWWLGGATTLLSGRAHGGPFAITAARGTAPGVQLDNHWVPAVG